MTTALHSAPAQRPDPSTGLAAGIANCRVCHSSVDVSGAAAGRAMRCPVCRSALHLRNPYSLQRTWALLLTAVICYIPANLYPIMTVIRFGRGQPDTIASGIVHLAADGQWPIAILVFAASIVVPLLKIAVLTLLLLSVHGGWRWHRAERARMYRFIDVIGRWSMIDIFMISILIALVHLGAVATVLPGPGAAFFAVVVLSTMLAAATFDERLIWDASNAE